MAPWQTSLGPEYYTCFKWVNTCASTCRDPHRSLMPYDSGSELLGEAKAILQSCVSSYPPPSLDRWGHQATDLSNWPKVTEQVSNTVGTHFTASDPKLHAVGNGPVTEGRSWRPHHTAMLPSPVLCSWPVTGRYSQISETGMENTEHGSLIQLATAESAQEVLPALGTSKRILTLNTTGDTPSFSAEITSRERESCTCCKIHAGSSAMCWLCLLNVA